MDYSWQGWFWLLISVVSLAFGGSITTYGWEVWSREFEKRKLIRKGVWRIICGTSLVILGGLSATYGWNVISLGEQRENLLKAVVQVWGVNNVDLKNTPLVGPVYYCEKGEKCGIKKFPTLETSALDAVLSSGLFAFDMPDNTKFFITVLNYKRALRDANEEFDRFNNDLIKTTGQDMLEKRIAKAKNYQKQTFNSPWGKNLLKQHFIEMGRLMQKYKETVEQQLDIKLPTPQELKEKVQLQEKSQKDAKPKDEQKQ